MTATLHHLPVPAPDTAPPDLTWIAAGLTLAGFLPRQGGLVALSASYPPSDAAAVAAEMERLAWADPVAVARLWEARPR